METKIKRRYICEDFVCGTKVNEQNKTRALYAFCLFLAMDQVEDGKLKR